MLKKIHPRNQNTVSSSNQSSQDFQEPVQQMPDKNLENQLELMKEMNNLREENYFRLNLISVLERINKNLEELSAIRELLEGYDEIEEPEKK